MTPLLYQLSYPTAKRFCCVCGGLESEEELHAAASIRAPAPFALTLLVDGPPIDPVRFACDYLGAALDQYLASKDGPVLAGITLRIGQLQAIPRTGLRPHLGLRHDGAYRRGIDDHVAAGDVGQRLRLVVPAYDPRLPRQHLCTVIEPP